MRFLPVTACLFFALTWNMHIRPDAASAIEPAHKRNVSTGLSSNSTEEANDLTGRIKAKTSLKGWDYVHSLLVQRGLDSDYVGKIFSDPRMPRREPLYFGLHPKESKNLYRRHNSASARKNALAFFRRYRSQFEEAADRYGVPESVLLAILQVETACGSYTGKSRVFYRLARLVSASAPDNIQRNYRRVHGGKDSPTIEDVMKRAKYLEDTFLPHTAAVLTLSRRLDRHPLDLRGSEAGAIGIPQFLPGHIDVYGVDGDGDGKVDVYSPADAIHSTANFLREHGWEPGRQSREKKEKAIWAYNPSEAYVSTVLALASALEPGTKRQNAEIAFSQQRD